MMATTRKSTNKLKTMKETKKLKDLTEFIDAIGLTKSNKQLGVSMMLDCSFYEIASKDIYVTDYDVNWDSSMDMSEANLLNSKSIISIFNQKTRRSVFISELMLSDIDFIRREIDKLCVEK